MRFFPSLFFSFLFLQSALAQFTDSSFVRHMFQSEAFGEDRQITVYLPERYFDHPEESMMVTYLLDAQGPQYFNMLLGNLDYLISRYIIIPTIIVGIHSKNRYAEFTPPPKPDSQNEQYKDFNSQYLNYMII